MNKRKGSLEPEDDDGELKKQSSFAFRQVNSSYGEENESQQGEFTPKKNEQNENINFKINGSDSNLEEQQQDQQNLIKSQQYRNMDGEQILRYIKVKLKTNPFQRYQIRNHKFPIKFLLHILLIAFVTMQVKIMATQEIDYTRFNIDFWKSTLLNIDQGDDNHQSKFFFTPEDLKKNLEETISFFQNIQTQTQFEVIDYDQTKFYLLSYYTIWPTDKSHKLAYCSTINLKEGITQPFQQDNVLSIKDYTQKVNMFYLLIQNLQTRFSVNSNICWDIKIMYMIESGFKVEASVDADQVVCDKIKSKLSQQADPQQDVLRNLQEKFSNTTFLGEKFANSQLKLKQFINELGTIANKQNRRIVAEALSNFHITKEWNKFLERRDKHQLVKPVKQKGYQRIKSPFSQKHQKSQFNIPTEILLPTKGRILKQQNTLKATRGFQTAFINFMVIIISSLLFFLHMRYVYRIFVLYECAKQATDRAYLQNIRLKQSTKNIITYQNQQTRSSQDQDRQIQTNKLRNIYDNKHSLKWENITLREKLKFFNKWQLLSMVGNFFQICGSILLYVSSSSIERQEGQDISFIFDLKERLIGFGCAIAWITVVQYVEYDRDHIIFSNLMSKVINQWLYTLIGIFPIFMAFGIFGYCMYSDSVFFHSFSYTMTTLFATYHGDQISDFMNSIKELSSPLEQMYMLLYTMLFAMAVYNFFTSTIGLAWEEIKEKKKNKLLKQQLRENYLVEEELFRAKNQGSSDNNKNQMRLSQDQKVSSDQLLEYKQSPLSPTQQLTPSKSNIISKQISGENEEEIVTTSEHAFDRLIEYINRNKQDIKKISQKVDEHKKYIWTDTIAKKSQIEQLFKEMVDFDQIIDVLDIGHQDKDVIKLKYKKYFNYIINQINRLQEDICTI
ncbi:transmembrane protein, putative (macronuclear) [Tetrahymena thermophila SB210]|uniref:Transmembrane protein, putative n=1 Tax=Tetrahymena thermophila (strain SB210) TaxID=312017 RepID=W7X3E5_TETTS|nr:transmembrane protein, putative [Tetrahymena thermophila SB210]EWS70948.1 transmembrane protein, putative [Tetrahymena thermophila SB210]|eukprot:XP_012656504.1 transmembrane protein, putative [Tetrahymena thermophila SB210]